MAFEAEKTRYKVKACNCNCKLHLVPRTLLVRLLCCHHSKTAAAEKHVSINAFLRLLLQVLQLLGNLLDDSGGQRLCSLQLMQVA